MQVVSPTAKRFCPRCGRGYISKSRFRGAIEQFLLRAVGVQPYRCRDCDKRFYGHSNRKIPMGGSLSRDTPH